MIFDNTKDFAEMTKDYNKYIKERLKFEVKEDKDGRLYANLKLPILRSGNKLMDIVDVEFYLDQLELRPIGDLLEVSCSSGPSLKIEIDRRPREVIFKAKEIKDGVYATMTTHKMMTMEEIENKLGHKVILKDDDKFYVGELMKYYENLLK